MEVVNKRLVLEGCEHITINEIFDNYYELKNYVIAIVISRYRNKGYIDPQDILHDVYLNIASVYENNKELNITSSYIKTTVKHTILKSIRKYTNNLKHISDNGDVGEIDIVVDVDNIDEIIKEKLDDESKIEALYIALGSLSEAEKMLLNYSLILGQTTIEDISGLSYSTINTELKAIKSKLKEHINQILNEKD